MERAVQSRRRVSKTDSGLQAGRVRDAIVSIKAQAQV